MTSHRRGTTKSGGQKHTLDKFYTNLVVAKTLIDSLDVGAYDVVIEPSAGSGAFSSQVAGCLALDLAPEGEGILEQDFFTFTLARDAHRRTLVLGNPPFGQQNSLALRFLNHAAQFADTIAFVLPISFRKASVQAKIDSHLHLVSESDLPKNAFLLDGAPYHVPSTFQVWEWRAEPRVQVQRKTTHPAFAFVKDPQQADLRIQRVGGRAGLADTRHLDVAAQSNYFVRVEDPTLSTEDFILLINSASFPGRDHGVGPRTIAKTEVVAAVEAALADR